MTLTRLSCGLVLKFCQQTSQPPSIVILRKLLMWFRLFFLSWNHCALIITCKRSILSFVYFSFLSWVIINCEICFLFVSTFGDVKWKNNNKRGALYQTTHDEGARRAQRLRKFTNFAFAIASQNRFLNNFSFFDIFETLCERNKKNKFRIIIHQCSFLAHVCGTWLGSWHGFGGFWLSHDFKKYEKKKNKVTEAKKKEKAKEQKLKIHSLFKGDRGRAVNELDVGLKTNNNGILNKP